MLGGVGLCHTIVTAGYIFIYDVTTPRAGRTNHRCVCRRDKHGVSHPLSGAVAHRIGWTEQLLT